MGNGKIIGFLIRPNCINVSLDDIDVFNVGLNFIEVNHGLYTLYFWGTGDISGYKKLNKFSFNSKLGVSEGVADDRNIFIDFSGDDIIIENDWLGSIPIFYNIKDKIVSTLSIKTIKDFNDIKYDIDGIEDYISCGFCLYGNTIIKQTKSLRYFSKIIINDKTINVIEKKDDCCFILQKFLKNTTSKIVIEKIGNKVNSLVDNKQNIIIPTSGGFDSRFLNSLVREKKKIRSFSYGISKDSKKSFETVYAKELSKKLGTKFNIIELYNYCSDDYMKKWFKLFGISTHLHGMYHIEFYNKIKDLIGIKDSIVLSGIIGDLWAGKVVVGNISTSKQIKKLYYSHGIHINRKYLLENGKIDYSKKFFNANKDELQNELMRIIFLVRNKMILLSYLMIIPEYLGFSVETPFLNKNIALKILSIPDGERRSRRWQKQYFIDNGILFENMKLNVDISNYLDQVALSRNKETFFLNNIPKFFDIKHINRINENLKNRSIENRLFTFLSSILGEKFTTYLKFGLNKFFGIRWLFNKNLDAYYHYLILKVFEYVEKMKQ